MSRPDTHLQELAEALAEQRRRRLPPVHEWNPDNEGDSGMRITRDGTWYYNGSPIERRRMVKLFSTVLRRDDDGRYYLVTPVEKLAIAVDDKPFVAVEMFVTGRGDGQEITLRTQVDDYVTIDEAHPLTVEEDPRTGEPSPCVLVRDRLEALLARPVYYQLVDIAEERREAGRTVLGVRSAGRFFPIGALDDAA